MAESTNNAQITEDVRRRAAEYAKLVRSRYGDDAAFDTVDQELAADWAKQSGNDSVNWASVRGVVQENWGRRDSKTTAKADATANKAKFSSPPTFGEAGGATPRNRDEPNM